MTPKSVTPITHCSLPLCRLWFSERRFPCFGATEPMGHGPQKGVLPCRVWVCAPPHSISRYQSPSVLITASVMSDRFRISCEVDVPAASLSDTDGQIWATQCWNCAAEDNLRKKSHVTWGFQNWNSSCASDDRVRETQNSIIQEWNSLYSRDAFVTSMAKTRRSYFQRYRIRNSVL